MRPLNRTIKRIAGRRGRRTGMVLLLVLGVLAILSIAALSYVAIVRLDRGGTAAATRRGEYSKQVQAAVDHVRDLLAADLFGNKIVTPDVPKIGPNGVRNWPSMFEDGDWMDVPRLDHSTMNQKANPADPNTPDTPEATRPPGGRAWADDAWLAANEPRWDPDDPNNPNYTNGTRFWQQITNLRSAYTWDNVNMRWVRGDGRFVDLASWFRAPRDFYADPTVDLSDWTDSRVVRLSAEAGSAGPSGANYAVRVFDRQSSAMSNWAASGYTQDYNLLKPSDEHQWVDTDGDLRPDARWQTLPALDAGSSSLRWVVAARIIDASGLANVNSALESAAVDYDNPLDDNDVLRLGDGRTPADVSLTRLLHKSERRHAGQPYAHRVLIDRLFFVGDVAFRSHLLDGLGVGAIIDEAREQNVAVNLYTPWVAATPLEPRQRAVFWEWFGQNPIQPISRRGRGYPVRDLLDLGAYWATNNAAVTSRIEHSIDGTENAGYLPGADGDDFGPMRAKERPEMIRKWWDGTGSPTDPSTGGLPTPRQIKQSLRRQLTPVSGVGTQSPVPVLNPEPPFEGRYRFDKVRVDRPLGPEQVREAFASFVWALAPLATNQPLTRALQDAGPGNGFAVATENAHYGGSMSGGNPSPARHLYPAGTDLDGDGIPEVSGPPNASYAVITAASLASNLADAVDSNDTPTIAALFNGPTLPDSPPPLPVGTVNLTTRLPQGDVPATALPWVDSTNPYVIVALDRQPFLREATFMAFYSDLDTDLSETRPPPDYIIENTTDQAEVIGSALMIVLQNPWPMDITISPSYQVVVPETPRYIDDPNTASTGPFRITLPAGTIPANEAKAFIWVFGHDGSVNNTVWEALRREIEAKAEFNTEVSTAAYLFDSDLSPQPDVDVNRLPFAGVLGPVERGVLLTYQAQRPTGGTIELVLDRMRPPTGTFFPDFGRANFDFRIDRPDNYPRGFDQSWFVDVLGYDLGVLQADSRWNSGGGLAQISGRLSLSTSLSRPTVTRNGGMTAAVIEDREKNKVRNAAEAVAWLWPADLNDPARVVEVRDGSPHSLVTDIFPPPPPPSPPTGSTGIDFPRRQLSGSEAALTYADLQDPYTAGAAELPVFQLFVPNTGLIAVSDMLRICIYAHSCKDAKFDDLAYWRTASEKLGASLDYRYGVASGPAQPNPYLGVLDPSKYVLTWDGTGDLVSVSRLPDTMATPLAVRVPECFEALRIASRLVHGKVNLNTASREVIEALPLVAPEHAVPPLTESITWSNAVGLPASSGRADLIDKYRDPTYGPRNLPSIDASQLPTGLRSGEANPSGGEAFGFASPAELAVLGRWDLSNGIPEMGQTGTFLELGADDASNDTPPLRLEEYILQHYYPPHGAQPTLQDYQNAYADIARVRPVDDPEERLALYRAVSNIASVRSDVFLAWIVLRAYDARSIERVRMPSANPSLEQALAAMDNPNNNFQPVYESRWLLVLDRSQTDSGLPLSTPLDRPRVLMQVELPPARP